jgi:hypothetical protein
MGSVNQQHKMAAPLNGNGDDGDMLRSSRFDATMDFL